jgi:hypothetical protein
MFMGISPEKSKSDAKSDVLRAGTAAGVQAGFVKSSHRKILYRGLVLVALLASLACVGVAAAQEERPQITPGERKVPRKKEAGPRAVGVLQFAANGKTSLVPVAILISGKFWDATAYKADPIPMALETGTVYEAERAGNSLGLFTVSSALHSKAVNVPSPWIGTGKWLAAGAEEANKALKAEAVPLGIDTGDGPPRLTRNPQPAASAPGARAPSSTPAEPSSPSSGDEPPRLTKGVPAPAPAPSTGSAAPTTPGDSKSPDAKPEDAKAAERAKVPESDSGASESGRPTLRRGKPTEALPEDELPGYSKVGAAAAAPPPSAPPAATASKGPEAAADMGPVQLVPAISDAAVAVPRSFTFEWLKDEEGERRQQMVTLAKEQVRAYVDARARAKITPKPAGPQTARHAPAAKTKDPVLDKVQMTAYDLWGNNQPVLVFSAEAHLPPPPTGAAFSAVDAELQYSILLVAYPDTYNNLHKIYSGVTDKYHLDLTPRLELIDALDADGDLRGELLFRETSDNGTGWVIYRASADKLSKMFDSLHPE